MTTLTNPRFGRIPSLLTHAHTRRCIKTALTSFGEACPGCHIRFIEIFRHQKGKKTPPTKASDFRFSVRINKWDGLPMAHRPDSTRLPSNTTIRLEHFWGNPALIRPFYPHHPCFALTDLIRGPLHWVLCEHEEYSAFFLPARGWIQESHTSETGEEETQMSYVEFPEKERLRIQVFWAVWAQNWVHQVKFFSKGSTESLKAITSFWNNIYTLLCKIPDWLHVT